MGEIRRFQMFMHTLTTFYIPLTIYTLMGIFIARIQLHNGSPKQFNLLKWVQFIVDVLRIVFLWPLVLFIEKSKSWLEDSDSADERVSLQESIH
jgi:hypothetical protein